MKLQADLTKKTAVSILVVLDQSLRHDFVLLETNTDESFNPCCFGSVFETGMRLGLAIGQKRSFILVVLDQSLRLEGATGRISVTLSLFQSLLFWISL